MKLSFPKKSLAIISLTALMASSQSAFAAVQASPAKVSMETYVQVNVNNKPVAFPDAKAYLDKKNNRTMVPVRFVSEALGAKVDWVAKTQTVNITQGQTHITFRVGQKYVNKDGKSIVLDAIPVIKNTRTFVPLRFVSEALHAKVAWDGLHNLVSIETDNQGSSQNQTSTSSSSQTTVLTKELAIEKALAGNGDLLQLRIDVSSSETNATLVHAQVHDIPASLVDTLDMAKQKYIADAQAQTKANINKFYLKATEDKVKLGAEKSFYDYVHALADLELKKQSLQRAQEQLRIAKLAVQVGTRAKTDELQAEAGVAGAQAALAASQSNVETARVKLNEFIGEKIDKQWTVSLKNDTIATQQPMNMENAIALAVKQRAEVKQTEEELNIAQLNLELIGKFLALSTYQGTIGKNEVEKAKLALEKAKQDVTVEVTQNYYMLKSAQASIDAYKKAKDASAENYRLSKLRYQNGLATILEVIQSEEDLSNREYQYEQAQHNLNLAYVSYVNSIGNSAQ